jgi:hypothetical protein
MTVKERLAELERQHKALEREIAEALGQTSIDDLKITGGVKTSKVDA